MSNWHLLRNGKTTGPHSEEEIREWLRDGQIDPTDLLNREGMAEWVLPGAVPEFAAEAAAPAAPGVAAVSEATASPAPATPAPPTFAPPPGYPAPPAGTPPPPVDGVNAGSWITEAWQLFAGNAGVAIAMQFVYVAVAVVAAAILMLAGVPAAITGPRATPGDAATAMGLGSLLLGLGLCSLFLAVIIPALTLGLAECFWELIGTGHLTARRLLAGVGRFWSVLALSLIVFALLMVASTLTAGTAGAGGLISALLGYAVAGWFHLALYDMAARETGAIEALSHSWQLIQKDFVNVLLLAFLAAVINTAGTLLCCVGTLVSTPVAQIAWGCCYRDLVRKSGAVSGTRAD